MLRLADSTISSTGVVIATYGTADSDQTGAPTRTAGPDHHLTTVETPLGSVEGPFGQPPVHLVSS
jgi:hypothetical protein